MFARINTNRLGIIFWGGVLCSMLLLGANNIVAGNTGAYKQQFANATINWFDYTISAAGKGELPRMEMKWDKAEKIATRKAMMRSRYNLLQALKKLRIERELLVGELFREHKDLAADIRGKIHNSRITKKSVKNNQFVQVVTEIEIDSGFSRQLIPSGVWYTDGGDFLDKSETKQKVRNENNKDNYTGIIVDARNLPAKPALIFRLYDQEGKVVYGPAIVERHFALDQGMAIYVSNKSAARETARVGKNPLVLRAIEAVENATCDLVLPSGEAGKLQRVNTRTDLLNESRLAIILKPENNDGLVEYTLQ